MSEDSTFTPISFYRYRLPFKKPFQTQDSTYKYREGIVLTSQSDNIQCWGEVAPLPGFSSETLQSIQHQIDQHLKKIQDLWAHSYAYKDWNEQLNLLNLSPALHFGLDTLFLDRASQLSNQPLHKYLDPSSSNQIPLNGVIGYSDVTDSLTKAQQLVANGFKTLKIKVGRDHDRDTDLLTTIRHQFPELTLRIDANKAWSLAEAHSALKQWQNLELQYCEEPLLNADIASYQQLRQSTPVPLAWDESLTSPHQISAIIEAKAADLFIIKPMRFGSYQTVRNIAGKVADANLDCVFTTLLESGIGRRANAHIAASLLKTDSLAHGLATGRLFADDWFSDNSTIVDGTLTLEEKSGLGISMNWPVEHAEQTLTKLY